MTDNNTLFSNIATDLQSQGYSVQKKALPNDIGVALKTQFDEQCNEFTEAGLGRGSDFRKQENIRRDEVLWIQGDNPAEQAWLNWCEHLREHLNRELYLGLFSFESHFAHYSEGDFYKRHLDAFRPVNSGSSIPDGKPRRKLSLTTYFNDNWQVDDGGELVIYPTATSEIELEKVAPENGTLCIFLSEEFPHEVLPATRDRYSIAGWFRTA